MKKLNIFLAAFLGIALSASAKGPDYFPPVTTPPTVEVSNCDIGSARADLDINNVRALIYDGGDMWWDLNSTARYEVPKVDDPSAIKRNSLFAGSIWVSGKEQGTNNIYVMAMTYRRGNNNLSYWPGPIDNVTTATNRARCQVWDNMFKINRTEVEDFEARFAAGLIRNPSDLPQSVRRWPAKGNPYISSERGFEGIDVSSFDLARFVDRDGDGLYDPLAGDSPRLPGREDQSSGADQCIFFVMNDVGGAKKFEGNTQNNRAIGMEVQTEAFAYATSDYVNDMTFYRNKLINKGTTILGDCYFGQWADADLGYASDDYVQFSVPRGLAITYNGDDFDDGVNGYGANPPSVAIDFFKGPVADPGDGIDNDRDAIIDEPGELIISSSFVYYNNTADLTNGNPEKASDFYNYQRSIWRNGKVMTYDLANGTKVIGAPVDGISGGAQKAVFIFPGASDVVGWGNGGSPSNPRPLPPWSEVTANNPPGDRRMLTNAGGFTLRPGAVNELTIGVVWARATTGGATGSFNKLLAADDAAQKLFDNDFKILDGPDAPIVEISELDQQLIFTILPRTSRAENGAIRTTETYQERDFNSLLTDPFYRFEGYLVYQFADATVGFGDLDNPDKAKLIANVSSDLKNGVGTILNQEFDENTGGFVQRVKVRGTDNGLIRNFTLDQDLFSAGGGKLINFHRYYFTVIAYGYNGDSNQTVKYIQGRQFRTVYQAIPHKVAPEFGGTVLNATYNQSINVVRLQGIGNSGVTFDSLISADEQQIVAGNSLMPLHYANGNAPVQVKIYNPKKVVNADLTLRLFGRVSYRGALNIFHPGDTIISQYDSIRPTNNLVKDPVLLQKRGPGLAVVTSVRQRLGGDADLVDLEVEMLNDGIGGRFTILGNAVEGGSRGQFSDYVQKAQNFFVKTDPSRAASCFDFEAFDFWRLYDSTGLSVDSASRPFSNLRDQLSVRYGLLVSITNARNPGEYNFTNPLDGLQTSSIVYADGSKPWVTPIPATTDFTAVDSASNWWSNSGLFVKGNLSKPGTIDINGSLRKVLGGSFANYGYLGKYLSDPTRTAGAYTFASFGSPASNFYIRQSVARLQNVDIVLTSDQSKWTRVIVIQGDSVVPFTGAQNGTFNFLKSRLSSVDKSFNPTGELNPQGTSASKGMSWFPGYAVDLDKGIRLNMAFLESEVADPTNGHNLKWEPTTDRFGGKSYIYVFANKYDEGRSNERTLDSISTSFTSIRAQSEYEKFWSTVSWVGRLRADNSFPYLATQTRIRLRIDKGFRSYPDSGGAAGAPTYSFSTKGLQATNNNAEVAKNALSLIRVVPNPYYAYSTFETSQIDNRVRITNLPTRCQISVFNISGSLIRRYIIDRSTEGSSTILEDGTNRNIQINRTTFQDWDLKTQTGLPIASGAYLIHINAYELGETTVKFFGVMRPTDLDAISQ